MERKSLFDDAVFSEILERINALTPDSRAGWGEMNVAQMLAHCAEIQDVINGKALIGTPLIARLLKRYIRKMVLQEKPVPHSIQTHPQYIFKDEQNFEEQKEHLIASMTAFKSAGAIPGTHPLFGEMSADERSWSMYRHLDHHLTQFGV